MKIKLSDLRNVVRTIIESANEDYVVRGGSEVLARPAVGSPAEWNWITINKVTYFNKNELRKEPRGSMDRQFYVFERDGQLYSVPAACMYSVPTVK